MKKSRNKYGAIKTEVNGVRFDSKRESIAWSTLVILQKRGMVRDLERQVKYNLVVNDIRITTYRPDFVYFDMIDKRQHVVDVKSPPTAAKRDFKIKCKLMLALYGITVEVWL